MRGVRVLAAAALLCATGGAAFMQVLQVLARCVSAFQLVATDLKNVPGSFNGRLLQAALLSGVSNKGVLQHWA